MVPSAGDDECWPWLGTLNSERYGVLSYNHQTLLAHRVSLEIERGEPLGGLHALHDCDNPPCVNQKHLYAGTQADNVRDRAQRGRSRYVPSMVKGEQSGAAKVEEGDVLEIRALHQQGLTLAAIASRFPIGKDAVWRIVKRKNWRHI
jgi:hypothetical protein